ncbi:hypothetical protein COCNU_04G013330 [Cocos nucifera]|uniref:Uncharacterized protein n=1 Tax=Cocos nucifera TaxID=13894 RepID=A0A8K0I7D0_COCNU|nr:hypothetical protein COCNU_04G013330 [Cocos nucifera]
MASASVSLIPSAHLPRISAHGGLRSLPKNLSRSRVSMSVSVGSRASAAEDTLFQDYKPSCAFLFPGQVFRFQIIDLAIFFDFMAFRCCSLFFSFVFEFF